MIDSGGMKPVQGSPVSSTMQEAFGCAVENRFFQLLDDESDPLDYLYQATSDLGKGKKKEETAGKKAGNQKSNKKESQKDRKIVVIANTDAPEAPKQRAPKPSMPKVPQNENSGPEVKVERSERRAVFREFRPNVIEKPLEYSVDEFEKEKQVRNWVSNQRGGTRGRGRGAFPRNMENDQRGKREFDRHSGSDRSSIKAEDKKGGGGPRNWGSFRDACSDVDPTPVENVEAMEPVEATTEEGQDVKAPEDYSEDYLKEMSLDEWKSIQDQSRPKVELNLRKPDTSVPSKARVIHKSKYVNNSKEDDEFNIGFRKPVNDITAQLEINFGSLPRPGRGGRGGGRGRVRREEPFPHEGHNVHEFVLNPDDPEDFPALT